MSRFDSGRPLQADEITKNTPDEVSAPIHGDFKIVTA
jgi:hypothetical protein